jgi:hypothetical protein
MESRRSKRKNSRQAGRGGLKKLSEEGKRKEVGEKEMGNGIKWRVEEDCKKNEEVGKRERRNLQRDGIDKGSKNGNTKKSIRKNVSKIGMWNIRSLVGKEIELVGEFERADLEILVVAETKRKGAGTVEMENGHLLVWSGVGERERAQAGVGCVLHRNIKKNLSRWEAVSERILTVELTVERQMRTVIAIYGPNETESAENKDKFWEMLNVAVEIAKGSIYIVGDVNGRVGKRDLIYALAVGKYGEEKRNNNGKRFLEFCTIHDLIVANTFYEHKEIHKYTREEPSRGEKSIIDYIVVERGNRNAIKDVKVKRGFEIGSDHYLLVATIRDERSEDFRKRAVNKIKIDNEIIRSYKLKEKEIADRYEEIVGGELEEVQGNTDNMGLEELWRIFKETILEAAKRVCGKSRRNKFKKQTAWWSEEIKQQVKTKKEKWQAYISNQTESNYEAYKEARIKTKRLVVEAKQEAWKVFGEKLEKDCNGNQKLFYRVLKNLRKNNKEELLTIKNEKGEIIMDEAEIMTRWKEYFIKLLEVRSEDVHFEVKREDIEKKAESRGHGDNNITMEEVVEAIRRMKIGKAPGSDKITAEMMKYMGDRGRQILLEILNKVWKEEKIPRDWEVGLIVPIYKKGDKKDCNNYRGITLLSTVMKILEQIIEKRLRRQIEASLAEAQSGFRKGRSTLDHIFTIQEIISKAIEKSRTIYIAFLDMEKAFDRVPRDKLWEGLQVRNVDVKLVNVIKCMYRVTRNCVISNNLRSDEFQTRKGIRQGGSLSPLLFIIFMDEIIKKVKQRIKSLIVGFRNLERIVISECAFADDIAVMAGSEKDLQENLNVWNEVLKMHGMKINKSKTKVMVVSRERKEVQVSIDEEFLEQVNSVQYLGINLEETGKQGIEVNSRIAKVNKVYHAMSRGLVNKKEISKQTKMKVYRVIYRPILTYGCEAWVLTEQEKKRIGAMEMKYLRRVEGVTKRDRIRNSRIREEIGIESIEDFIEKRQLGWWGHLQRMNDMVPVKRIWETRMHGKRKRGRPRETWDKVISKILKKRGKTWVEAKSMAQDRNEWKKFVEKRI